MIDLSTKCVLVTGATGGIGKEIVTTCLSLGAKVIATGRNIEKLEEIKSNNNLLIIKCDLTNPEEVDHLLIHIDSLDGVVHCAGKIFPYPTQ